MRKLRLTRFASILMLTSVLFIVQSGKAQSKLQESIDRGKTIYMQRCLSCHQLDGTGIQNINPPLVKTKAVLGKAGPLVELILKGMNAGAEIDGVRYNNAMLPAPDMSDTQIADVLNYIRNSFGNKAKAVTDQEVKTVRSKLK